MAKRLLNRRELRQDAEAAEKQQAAEPDAAPVKKSRAKKPKPDGAPAVKVKRPRKKKEPPHTPEPGMRCGPGDPFCAAEKRGTVGQRVCRRTHAPRELTYRSCLSAAHRRGA